MPRVVTSVRDPVALAAACCHLGVGPPRRNTVRLDGEMVSGLVVCLPGLRFPVVFDVATGLVAYHRLDNGHEPYGRLMRFVCCYYALLGRHRCRPNHARSKGRRSVARSA
jgi:hypothetical protein